MNRLARQIVILGMALPAALAGSAVVLGARADSQFLFEQRNPHRLTAAQVERAVRTAPDPLTGRGQGREATCRAQGSGPLRNPWRCVVTYGASRRVPIDVEVAADGTYSGRYRGGGTVRGCCVPTP